MAAKMVEAIACVALLLCVLAGTSTGQDHEQPDIIEEVLTQPTDEDLDVSMRLGFYRTLSVRAFNVQTINVEAVRPTTVSYDDKTISLDISDLTIEARADWSAEYSSLIYNTGDHGTMRYILYPVSMFVAFDIDRTTAEDVHFQQTSCNGDMAFSEFTIDSDKGYSWFYESITGQFEGYLTAQIMQEVCKFLNPEEQDVLARRLKEAML